MRRDSTYNLWRDMKKLITGDLVALAVQVSAAAVDQPIFLATAHGRIAGSLMLPASSEKTPVVLIISGSGPTDRDGNSAGIQGRNDALKMLAQSLSDAGFASVRYDKRGVGASAAAAGREAELRLDNFVEDAAAWIDLLATDTRFSGVTVVGHSEGSLIGMLAAKGRAVTSFVSIVGVAKGAASILRQQLVPQLPADLIERNNAILSSLERGELVGDVPLSLATLYRPSVQPYLISWFRRVPALEIKALGVACLILQGDTDIQVSVAEAMALIAAKPDAELQIIHGMNHVLKQVGLNSAQQIASYGDPALPIAPGLSQSLARFLSAHRSRQ
jgi:pimeloyl-ACP methyl ester carboxylesterase